MVGVGGVAGVSDPTIKLPKVPVIRLTGTPARTAYSSLVNSLAGLVEFGMVIILLEII